MTAHENQDVTLSYTYVSGSNRKATEITVVKGLGNLTRTTALGYDASARLNGFYRANVFNVAFTHASNGLIGTVTNDSPPPLAQYAYDSGGLVQAIALENGLTTTWSRDLAGQPLGVLTKDATNTVISGVTHTLDAATRRKSATYEDNLGQAYAYDAASQVTDGKVNIANAATAAASAGPTHAYTYDPAGNRNSSLAFGQSTSYIANNVNAYTAISGGGFQPPSPTYDAKGNTLSLPRANGTTHGLIWDSQDRLRTVTPSGSTAHSMVYDPLGRLVWSRRPDGGNPVIDEVWSWSSWTLLAREVFQSSTLVETYRYTWGPDLSGSLEGAGGVGGLLAIERAEGGSTIWDIRHAHADANGNILSLTTGSGLASARYRYSPFGETISSQDLEGSGWATRNIHRFSTKPEIAGMGLLYYGYRFYDPQTGRWPSRDPIGEEGGINLYGMVANDPVNRWDLLGMVTLQEAHDSFKKRGGGPRTPSPRWILTRQKIFDEWYRLEKAQGSWWSSLPKCPKKLCIQKINRGGTEKAFNSYAADPSQWNEPDRPTNAEENLHPGTTWSMRSKADGAGHANQCTYDTKGILLRTPPGSGTVDWYRSGTQTHYNHDVAPVYLANSLDGGASMGVISSTLTGGPSILGTPGANLNKYFEVRPLWAESP